MSATMTGYELLSYIDQQMQIGRQEMGRLAAVHSGHEKNAQTVRAEHESAWTHLLGLLVRDLSPGVLDAAVARIGLPALRPAAVAERADEWWRALTAERARIEADPLYVGRASALNEVSIRVPLLTEQADPLRDSVDPLKSEPTLAGLLEANYGTSDYQGRFWHLSYYTHWKTSDLLVERHGARMHVSDFGALRAKYLAESEALATLDDELRRFTDLRTRIEALVARHEQISTSLATIEPWSLQTARGLAREHLAALEDADRLALFANDPALSLAAKRISATAAKTRYLDAISGEWLDGPLAGLQRHMDKLQQASQRLRASPKKMARHYIRAEMENKYAVPLSRTAEKSDRYVEVSTVLVHYDDYDAVDLAADILWWDYMTDRRYKASFIPEVHHYHSSHHHHHYDHGPDVGYRDSLMQDAS